MTFKSFFAVSALILSTLVFSSSSAQEIAVIKFSASWCGPCKQFAPIFEQVSKEYSSKAEFRKVDIDANKPEAHKFNVRSIPTTIILKNGIEVERITGAPTKHEFVNKLKYHCGR